MTKYNVTHTHTHHTHTHTHTHTHITAHLFQALLEVLCDAAVGGKEDGEVLGFLQCKGISVASIQDPFFPTDERDKSSMHKSDWNQTVFSQNQLCSHTHAYTQTHAHTHTPLLLGPYSISCISLLLLGLCVPRHS